MQQANEKCIKIFICINKRYIRRGKTIGFQWKPCGLFLLIISEMANKIIS